MLCNPRSGHDDAPDAESRRVFDEEEDENGLIYELCDTGYAIRVNGTEFASFEDWVEWEAEDSDAVPLTDSVDRKKGEKDAEIGQKLRQGKAA